MEPIQTPAVEHDPPSVPASPSPKRFKSVVASPAPAPEAMSAAATHLPSMKLEPPPPALQIKLLSATARAPTRGSEFAAGYDLYASKSTTVPARGKVLADTDISIAVPADTYGRVAPRSGLAAKHSIDVGAGVIDADYRGPLKVLLFNLGETDFAINEGDRIAQLIIERIYTPEVLVVEQLPESVRGAGGFGSTGGFANMIPPVNPPASVGAPINGH
ncbi:dUTP diphosphatase [Aureobasidium sp. EXF-10728]|nr:dUTP diphosphatase [Aureobasidium sp. EXF-10728]